MQVSHRQIVEQMLYCVDCLAINALFIWAKLNIDSCHRQPSQHRSVSLQSYCKGKSQLVSGVTTDIVALTYCKGKLQ